MLHHQMNFKKWRLSMRTLLRIRVNKCPKTIHERVQWVQEPPYEHLEKTWILKNVKKLKNMR